MGRQSAIRNLKSAMASRGFTLIELLVVMGIILMMTTLALVSVNSMLRSTRMSRGLNLLVAAADEARTAAITLRRSTRVDLTRLDKEGGLNRLTVVGPFVNENFDTYEMGTSAELSNQWLTTGDKPEIVCDGSRCLKMSAAGGAGGGAAGYWHSRMRVNVNTDDYEVLIQGRVKFLPQENQAPAQRSLSLLGSIDDGSGGGIKSAYRMSMTVTPFNAAENMNSTVVLDRIGGGSWTSGPAPSAVDVDLNGAPSATTMLVDDVWYRVILSVKTSTSPDGITRAAVAGKVWADGQLEPQTWTVGPVYDSTPLNNGCAGFQIENCTALADDVLFDVRPIRVLPPGMRMDVMDPASPGNVVPIDSGYGFPLLFRPDGTTATVTVRLTDVSTGDRRYVTIYQNTGHSRFSDNLTEAMKP
jgi:prepilin-type N-terminal cleavage/methylation domain-containing protein